MDTRLLRSFLAVARFSSFTEAALELGYTQSTVTSHVQKLERQLGRRVLDRLSSGVQLTENGKLLIIGAEELLAAEDRLRAAVTGSTGRPRGTVRIMAPESLCTYRLPAIIRTLRADEPDVQIWLSPGGLSTCVDAVTRGAVDVALTMEPRLPASELTAEPIGAEPLVLIGEYEESAPEPCGWAELARRDVLLIEEGCGYSDDISARLGVTGATPGRRSYFGSIEAIKRCVAVGLGWAAVPAVTADEEIKSGIVSEINGPGLPDCEVHMLTHSRRHLSAATTTALEALRSEWSPKS